MPIFTTQERDIIIQTCANKGIEEYLKTWRDVTEHLNNLLKKSYADSKTYRSVWTNYILLTEASEKKREIQIEKNKLADTAREYRTDIRNQSRIEVLHERTIEAIKDLPSISVNTLKPIYSKVYGVVNASDWHIGALIDNYWNKYSLDIAKERIDRYASEVIKYCKLFKLEELLVLNMGDMIEGFIHISTRIQAELNAIDQTVYAAELFSKFLVKLRNELRIPIKVGSVLDNHSRIHPNKKEHIEAESLQRLLMHIVEIRLKDTDIEFVGNYIDENVGHYQLGDKNIVWAHGHLDNPANAVARLQKGLPFKINDLIIAHRHSTLIKSDLYQVPSMMGVNDYAKDKRLFDYAAQSFRIYEGKNKITFEVIF